MALGDKELETLREADLLELIRDQVAEQKTIDYKRDLPGQLGSDRKEFLSDVSSFANAAGGHIVYGMVETAGLPTQLCGVGTQNPDAEVARLDNIARTGLSPRVVGLHFRAIPLASGAHAVVARIPRSWSPPHQVILDEDRRFYGRNSNGKHRLDVGELRAIFARSQEGAQRVRAFRIDRLARIVADETPVPVDGNPKLVLHVVPLSVFDPGVVYDVARLRAAGTDLSPLGAHVSGQRHNFDGFLTYGNLEGGTAPAYLQVFRNGSVETVNADIVEPDGTNLWIPITLVESELRAALGRIVELERRIGSEPPVVVMLSMLGVRGYMIPPRGIYERRNPLAVDRDDLVFPEVLVDSYQMPIDEVLRPLFDAIWNSSGYEASANYDDLGRWTEGRRR